MLSRMFSSSLEYSQVNEHGDHVINYPVSADVFAAILKFYRTGTVQCPPTTPVSELHEACKFFLIPFDHTSIDCSDVGKFLHELSNKGAIKQFEAFLKNSLLPAMAKWVDACACVRACVCAGLCVCVSECICVRGVSVCMCVFYFKEQSQTPPPLLPFFLSGGRCAEIGDRKCHIVVLRNEQTVEWDEDLPPALGEQFAKGV